MAYLGEGTEGSDAAMDWIKEIDAPSDFGTMPRDEQQLLDSEQLESYKKTRKNPDQDIQDKSAVSLKADHSLSPMQVFTHLLKTSSTQSDFRFFVR